MNNFYKQHKILQWLEAISMLIVGFLPALFIIEKGHAQQLHDGNSKSLPLHRAPQAGDGLVHAVLSVTVSNDSVQNLCV
jgi:hypothetical protein